MIKRLLLFTAIIGLGFSSCKEKDNDSSDGTLILTGTIEEQLETIKGLSYSQLTPNEQKLKLESDAKEVLDQMTSMKSSPAIDAFDNLEALLKLGKPDFSGVSKTKAATIEELLSISDVYGIYTWNAQKKEWTKTASTTEFKFSFPSKKSGTSNDAVVNMTSTNSGVTYTDEYYEWDNSLETYVTKNYIYQLPSTAQATLTIGSTVIATAKMDAQYANKKPAPEKANTTITLHDGYSIVAEGKQGTPSTGSAKFTYKDQTIFDATAEGTIDLKKLADDNYADDDYDYNYFGKANGVIKIMNNLVVIVEGDFTSLIVEDNSIYDNYKYYSPNTIDFITKQNTADLEYSKAIAANFNAKMKLTLASRKDLAKIADVIMVSELDDYSYYAIWNTTDKDWQSWIKDEITGTGRAVTASDAGAQKRLFYQEVYYLRFKDNTLVSLDSYFSEGFGKFLDQWDEFMKAFERK